MRRSMLIILQAFGYLLIATLLRAETATLEDLADSVCGEPGLKGHLALTAIQRLPPVRIIVFDPVSNSFAFVACEPETTKDGRTISNQDYLDRRRLALSTQKIRLFIMPYNPADGDLTLEKVEGEGVEFEEIPGADFPTKKQATEKAGTQDETKEGEVEDKPKEPIVPSATMEKRIRSFEDDVRSKLQMRKEENLTDQYRAVFEESSQDPWAARLAILSSLTDEYLELAAKTQERFETLRGNNLRCVRAGVDGAPIRFTRNLALSKEERAGEVFSMTHDVTLREVRVETARRLKLLDEDFYEPCKLRESGSGTPFEADARALDSAALDVSREIGRLKSLIAEISRTARLLFNQIPDKERKESAPYLASFGDFVQEAATFNESLATALNMALKGIDQLRMDHNTFQRALGSPAMQIQRFNYNPLANGKSITFTIRRGAKKDGDGDMIPARVNKIEIKSAPVYTMRFGMGLIASRLENPSFKVADFPVTNPTDEPSDEPTDEPATETEKKILFDDESNGRIVPGIFLHHYWGRKSPLLRKTAFEMFMPTISLGIPVSEANIFSQFMLGLDWEITTGFEVNVGYHFGRVNTLTEGLHVGDVLPTGVDVTSVQKKTFDSAFYFGVIVNRDAFERIFNTSQ